MKNIIVTIIFVVFKFVAKAVRIALTAAFRGFIAVTDRFPKKSKWEAVRLLQEEVNKLDWGDYEVAVMPWGCPPEAAAASNLADVPAEFVSLMVGGLTNSNTKRVALFAGGIADLASRLPWKDMATLARELARHENRHVQQFRLLEAAGPKAMFNASADELFSLYGTSILEQDAKRFQKGKEDDLKVVLARYLK